MPVPQSFKAAIVLEPGAQNVIQERSLPPLEAGEVAIKITATAVNPVDWKMRDWQAFIDKYPAILGSDAAGEIAEVGPNVSGFAQYCKMPAALVSKTPKNISDEQAAGISLATVAVVTAFYDKTGHGITPPWEKGGEQVGKGKAVVIIGGASSVGQYAIQLARLSGFERIITNASPANHEFLKKLGAHVVLDRSQATVEDFKAAIGELPLDFLFDAISSKETQKLSVQIVQAAKTIASNHVVTVHTVRPDVVDPEATALSQSKEPKVDIKRVLGVGSFPDLRYLSEPMAKSLGGEDGYIAKGLYIPNRSRVVSGGLGAVEEALGLNRKGVSGEKVIFRPSEV